MESNGGLVLAGKILLSLDLDRRVNAIAIPGALEPKISNTDVIRSHVGLLVLGRTAYEDIELYRHNGYFRWALGITWLRRSATPRRERVPSSKTLRQSGSGAERQRGQLLSGC